MNELPHHFSEVAAEWRNQQPKDQWDAAAEVAAAKASLQRKTQGPGHDEEIDRLAALDPISYDGARTVAAESLGCRASTLDKEVGKRRAERAATDAVSLCADIDPCADPVNVCELLNDIRATVHRFIVCDKNTATAATLWCAFTWIVEYAQVAPLAIITAPEKGCGKTQLLDVIGRLSRRPLFASNITPAATFRVIEAKTPTLLIDEADAFFRENEELRGVINSGHTRTSAYVIRTVGDDFEVKQFSTWGAKAIAGIGKLPETVMSRGIVLSLRRKLKTEAVDRLRHAGHGLFDALAAKLARFGLDHGAAIGRARPGLPDELGDRAQDNWEHLLAIADLAGGAWPKEARRAALAIAGAESDAASTSEELLTDIREIFDADRAERMAMAELLRRLVEDETGPWATWNRGKPMTARQLGGRLKEFGIHAGTVALSHYEKPKGFRRTQFADAWARYLDNGGAAQGDIPSPDTPISSVTRSPFNNSGAITGDRTGDRREIAQSPGPSVTHGANPTERVTDGAGDRREIAQSPAQSPGNPLFSGQGDRVTDGDPLPAKGICDDYSPPWGTYL